MSEDVLDPHIHLWDQRNTPRKPTPLVKLLGWKPELMMWVAGKVFPADLLGYFGRPDYVLTDYLQPEYRADTAPRRLVGCVHVQAGWEARGPMGPVGETRWLDGMEMPELLGIVGYADFALGEAVEDVLVAHLGASERFRGVRYMLSNHADRGVHSFCPQAGQSRDPTWRAGYARLGKLGLRFDAWCYHHQLDEVADLAGAFPEIPVALCHAGTPVGLAGPFSRQGTSEGDRQAAGRDWRAAMARLAERPNVSVKISGLTMPALGFGFHERAPPDVGELAEALGPLVRFVIDTFGPARCMFASNFPVDKVSCRWGDLFDAYERIVAGASGAERAGLFRENAARFYGLPLGQEAR
jgi:L-fuconolactonase